MRDLNVFGFPPARGGPGRRSPARHHDWTSLTASRASALPVERLVLKRVLSDWCGHLCELCQLSKKCGNGRARLPTRVTPEAQWVAGLLPARCDSRARPRYRLGQSAFLMTFVLGPNR